MKATISEEQKAKITANAKSMFSFVVGQKVIWGNGRYDHYYIQHGYKENGIKFYDILNPLGIVSPRIRESELISA